MHRSTKVRISNNRCSNNNVTAPVNKPSRTTNYELLGKDWATRAPVAQTLQSVRQACSRTTTTCACTFARFPFSAKFKPTRTSTLKQRLETTNVTAPLNTSRNDKLRVAWEGLGNTRAGRTNTANRALNMPTHQHWNNFQKSLIKSVLSKKS